MSEHDVTVTSFEWPQQHVGPDGTLYWVDSAGEVFSPQLHTGPMTDDLGVDANGLWLRRAKPRRGRPRKARQPEPALELLPPAPRGPMPDVVWVIWHIKDDQVEAVGAYADPAEALETLLDTPGGRVSRAFIQ